MTRLLEIQRGYFDIVKKYFGHFYDEAKRTNTSAVDLAEDVMRHPYFSKIINDNIDREFGEEINKYWNDNFYEILKELKKLNGLKLYFSGDISPANSGIVNRLGLYSDTIIIPDPTLRSIGSYMTGALKQHVRNFMIIKTAIKILDYEKIVFAKVPQPIALVFPAEIIINNQEIAKKPPQKHT